MKHLPIFLFLALPAAIGSAPGAETPAPGQTTSAPAPAAGQTFGLPFPELGDMHDARPAACGVSVPKSYDPAKPLPLLVWFVKPRFAARKDLMVGEGVDLSVFTDRLQAGSRATA